MTEEVRPKRYGEEALPSSLLIHSFFVVYWQTLARRLARVPGGPTANITLSPPIQGIILTPHTGHICNDSSGIMLRLYITFHQRAY